MNSPRTIRTLAFFLPALFAGCATEEAPERAPEVDLAAEAQAIKDLDAALSGAAQSRDAAAYALFFAEEVVQLPPDAPPVMGRTAVQESAGGLFGAGADLSFETTEVKIAASGNMAVSMGRWFLTLETPDGPVQDEGSYIEVWEKVSGEWKITWDIYNSDLPEG